MGSIAASIITSYYKVENKVKLQKWKKRKKKKKGEISNKIK
jgi:hypothetical protein